MKSIQSRLASGLLISLVTVFLLLWYFVSSNIQQLAENYIASRLEHDIETLVSATRFENRQPVIDPQRIDSIYQRPYSGHYYLLQHNGTTLRSRSLWDATLDTPAARGSTYVRSYQAGPQQQSLLVLSRQFNKQQQTIQVSVAEDLTPVSSHIERFKNMFAIAALLFLLLLILLQIFLLRRELRPLHQIRSELNELEQGSITELSSTVPDELKPLTREINHLSQALHQRLKRSRNALSDLSHAIKKPLTVLQQFIDRNPASLDADSLSTLNRQVTDIQQLTDRILKRARVMGRSQFNTLFRVNDDLPVLIQTVKSMYIEKQVEAEIQLNEVSEIQVDREDMLELLGNLVENAWKWAQHRVMIRFEKTDRLVITIEDDGPGADQPALESLGQRGRRLDESVEGYGFGLAIADDIVRDYDGELSFERSESLGGFRAKVELPCHQGSSE